MWLIWSLPAPPLIESVPGGGLPNSASPPVPPKMLSLPRPPSRKSAPPPPKGGEPASGITVIHRVDDEVDAVAAHDALGRHDLEHVVVVAEAMIRVARQPGHVGLVGAIREPLTEPDGAVADAVAEHDRGDDLLAERSIGIVEAIRATERDRVARSVEQIQVRSGLTAETQTTRARTDGLVAVRICARSERCERRRLESTG